MGPASRHKFDFDPIDQFGRNHEAFAAPSLSDTSEAPKPVEVIARPGAAGNVQSGKLRVVAIHTKPKIITLVQPCQSIT